MNTKIDLKNPKIIIILIIIIFSIGFFAGTEYIKYKLQKDLLDTIEMVGDRLFGNESLFGDIKTNSESTPTKNENIETSKEIGVNILSKGFDSGDFQDFITFDIIFENKTNRDIRGFKGTIIFNDIFGDPIKSIGITQDTLILANESYNWQGTIDYNQFIDSDVRLRNKELENIDYIFVIESILYIE